MTYDPTKDPGRPANVGPSDPATKAAAVAPNDNSDLPIYARALWIGVAGTISFVPLKQTDDTPVQTTAAAGVFPFAVRAVRSTGTTATQILAMFD